MIIQEKESHNRSLLKTSMKIEEQQMRSHLIKDCLGNKDEGMTKTSDALKFNDNSP